jgi:hypothetical protein
VSGAPNNDDDDDDDVPVSVTAMILCLAAGGFSLLVAAYLGSQAFPLSAACRAGDSVQCERYAGTLRQLEVFGGAGILFMLIAGFLWRVAKRSRRPPS